MNERYRIALRRRDDAGRARCAFCHGDVLNDATAACQACQAPHHLDCWVENVSCASCFHDTSDRPDEIRKLARRLGRGRGRRRGQPTLARAGESGDASRYRWTGLAFLIQVVLAFLVVVYGLLEGHSWVVGAYLVQGVALALYFAFLDTRESSEPSRDNRSAETAPPPAPEPEQLADRILIHRVGLRRREGSDRRSEVADMTRVDAPSELGHPTTGRELEPLPPLPTPAPLPALPALPPMPGDAPAGLPAADDVLAREFLERFRSAEPRPIERPRLHDPAPGAAAEPEPIRTGHRYHPFHDDIDKSSEFITRKAPDSSQSGELEPDPDVDVPGATPGATPGAIESESAAPGAGAGLPPPGFFERGPDLSFLSRTEPLSRPENRSEGESAHPTRNTGTPAAGTPEAGTPAAGTPEAGTPAAGTPEAGTSEAGTPEAGTSEAGTPEAGTPKAPESATIDGAPEPAETSAAASAETPSEPTPPMTRTDASNEPQPIAPEAPAATRAEELSTPATPLTRTDAADGTHQNPAVPLEAASDEPTEPAERRSPAGMPGEAEPEPAVPPEAASAETPTERAERRSPAGMPGEPQRDAAEAPEDAKPKPSR